MKNEGHNVKYMSPKEGAMTWVCGLCIMTGHDPDKVYKIYNYIDAYMSVDSGIFAITEYVYYGGHAKAFEQVDPQDGPLNEVIHLQPARAGTLLPHQSGTN
jgi:spermidine/putrescine transport system substrate-binding protein